jgi:hypothetical protein
MVVPSADYALSIDIALGVVKVNMIKTGSTGKGG